MKIQLMLCYNERVVQE